MATNYEIALKAEMKKVVRHFHHFTVDQISLLYSKVGNPCRKALDGGEFFYSHPEVPGIAFKTRSQAARYAMRGLSLTQAQRNDAT
jgi:hypothetical protein